MYQNLEFNVFCITLQGLKKIISIISITLATLALVAFAVVPHHHHADGVPCVVISHCDDDRGDSCTEGHHHASDKLCSVTASYIISETNHNDRCKVVSCCHDFQHLDVSFITIDVTSVEPIEVAITHNWRDFLDTDYQSFAALSMGLRAPPVA